MEKIIIEKARGLGFCFGVRRAIEIIERTAREHKRIVTIGPVVHNQVVVDRLAKLGVEVVDSSELMDGGVVAIPSHGVPPELLMGLQSRTSKVIDTTCPTVRRAQKAAQKLAASGFNVVIFGDSGHPEVKGLLGWAGGNAVATMDAGDIAISGPGRKLGIISQTTQDLSKFSQFVVSLLNNVVTHTQEICVINTICRKTQVRLNAAVELARRSDLMIVVGGRNSANTQRLAEACAVVTETRLVEKPDELVIDWLVGKKHIGVTAGASTPDEAIDDVVLRLRALVGSN